MPSNRAPARNSSLPRSTIIGYAVGEFGFHFFLVFIAYYLMYFLTDVLKLKMADAAMVFTLCQWFEALTVALSGLMIMRSRLAYRKWMLFGALICGSFTALMFTKLPVSASTYPAVFCAVYFVAYWGYNLMWISYRSLLGRIGKRPYDAVALSATGFQLGTVASLLFSYAGVRALTVHADRPAAFGASAAAYGILLVASISATYLVAGRYDSDACADTRQGRGSLAASLARACGGPALPLLMSIAFRSAVPVMSSALMIYYLRLAAQGEEMMPIYALSLSAAAFAGAALAKLAARRIDKRRVYVASGLANAAILASACLFWSRPSAFLVLITANAFVMVVGNVLVPSLLNDAAARNGRGSSDDVTALTFSLGRLSLNASQIIGSGLASYGLLVAGYAAEAPASPGTVSGLRYLMTLIPAALVLLGVGLFLLCKLDATTIGQHEDTER